jgi:hypothetical protein
MNTRYTPFSPIPALGQDAYLFAVPEGVRADFVMSRASAQLNAGVEALRYALCDQRVTPESASLWTALYALEGAAALIEALAMSVDLALSPPGAE